MNAENQQLSNNRGLLKPFICPYSFILSLAAEALTRSRDRILAIIAIREDRNLLDNKQELRCSLMNRVISNAS